MASAYIEAFGPEASGGCNVVRGSCAVLLGSQILMVRSNEPDANHCRSRLFGVLERELEATVCCA